MLRFSGLFLTTFLVLGNELAAAGQTRVVTIEVDDLQPMAAAIAEINKLTGSPINLEDVPVYHADDMVQFMDVQEALEKTADFLVPQTRQLAVSIVVDDITGKLEGLGAVENALDALVSAYNVSDLPGEYKLEYANESFFILPVKYRDATGIIQSMIPVLSTSISVPAEKRTLDQTYRAILDAFSQATGFHIMDARTGGMNGMENQVVFGATDEAAGHVLARFLSQKCMSGYCVIPSVTGDGLSWDTGLFFRLGFLPYPGFWCGYRYNDGKACYGVNMNRNWNRPPYIKTRPIIPRRFDQQ